MRIKVCGLKDPENIKQVAGLKPDYMGFIFYPASKRFVGSDFEMPVVSPEIKKVGVFVNAKADYIIDTIDRYKLDMIQLHGDEKPDFCEVMSHLIKVTKAFGVNEVFDLKTVDAYENCCDYFLFDTKTSEYGGSGKQFDWEIIKKLHFDIPFFISGGIGIDDITKISDLRSQYSNLFAVDVNSKFEIEPGLKDIGKLEEFNSSLITHHL